MTSQAADLPSAWQASLGQHLTAALRQSLQMHPGSREHRQPSANTTWRVTTSPGGDATAGTAAAHLAALQSPPGAARDQARVLYQRCLRHYREVLCADGADPDDLGTALAALLVASLQALEGHVASAERWQALRQWLQAWLTPWPPELPLHGDAARDALHRFSILAAALGEWSVQASRQGAMAEAGTRVMAQRWLQQELGLDGELLLRAMRWAGIVDAGNPSWGRTTLPKHRTGRAGQQRL